MFIGLIFRQQGMSKFCTNCGKQLSFFSGIFGSICAECQQQITLDKEKTNVEKKSYEKEIDSSSVNTASVLDKHFFYQTKIETFYRNRDRDGTALPAAIEACKQQISIAKTAKRAFLKEYNGSPLPSHVGYTQLCIILEKQKNYDEVIRLAKEAKKQGWNGDWDKRIERCRKKLESQKK
jgi:hypothetical protein